MNASTRDRPFGRDALAKRALERGHAIRFERCPARRLDADAALLRGQHQVEAAEDHRQRQPLAHVEARRLGESGSAAGRARG